LSSTETGFDSRAQFGYDPLPGDADAMTAPLKKDIAQWAEYVRIAKIQPQ